ncbi:MAG: superfamily, partial [Verrucomicrobiota bacterium]
TAFFAALALASWRIGLGFLLMPLVVAFSRMYVAADYLSDVVAALLIGAMAAYVVVNWKPLQIENRKPARSASRSDAGGSKIEN